MKKQSIESFFDFIYQRQLIWHKKEILKQPYPWTEDKILSTFKFCNAYRENDRCTKHLISTVINESSLTPEAKIFNIIFFRFFNIGGFFFNITRPQIPRCFSVSEMQKTFDYLIRNNVDIYNKAYIVAGSPFEPDYRPEDKHIQIILIMKDLSRRITEITKRIKRSENLEEVFKIYKEIFLIGDFLAYQLTTDTTYINGFLKHDINEFCNVGPGARPAIDMIFQSLAEGKYEGSCKYLWEIQELQFKKLATQGKDWLKIYYKNSYYKSPYLSLSNIQNCLCEYRKYINLQNKPTALKRYYHPEAPNGAPRTKS